MIGVNVFLIEVYILVFINLSLFIVILNFLELFLEFLNV